MKVRIIAVGSLNEPFWREAQAEYRKRLSRYLSLSVEEVADLPAPESLSGAGRGAVLQKEGEALLARVPPACAVYALDSRGKALSSEDWAGEVGAWQRAGTDIALLLGGSLGLSLEVKKKAKELISFGPMTLPHALARIVLLEQLYRACRILRSEPYHK